MREIREIKIVEMDQYCEIAFHSYPSYKDFSDEGKKDFIREMLFMRKHDPDIQFWGMFEGKKLIAQMRLLTFKMNFLNKTIQVGGLGSLAVHLMYKRQGIAREMIDFCEEYFLDQKIPLVTLLPFSPPFYYNKGYGYGTKMNRYIVPTSVLPKYAGENTCDFATKKEISKLKKAHSEMLHQTHGMAEKMAYEWENNFADPENLFIKSVDQQGETDGYAIFKFKSTDADNYTKIQILVRELVYTNREVLSKLIGFFANQSDQAQTIEIKTYEEDFHYLFSNPLSCSENATEYGYFETNTQYIGNMYKIIDLPLMLKHVTHRRYNNQSVCFTLTLQEGSSEQVYNIVIKEGDIEIKRTKEPFVLSVALTLSDFSSIFVGATTFGKIYAAGRLECSDPNRIKSLDDAFSVERGPVCWSDY
ncbi:GNAT family N-acetyltransferase [Candidatus Enterococcus murrayae]|uniref:GNAT family N-acetyltransferase n=1 Tax=Candidatus Enterococcus murrayae TaxID=2815321 RepID=A0ABS3HEF7_9ENTE|nr:GNAT family N-acetyltransferase [Enterococcus sp. MJM16]MBO0451841.1 GNAT family N-acetyltransferase [Enterococcus sp. MJM16]